MIDLFPILQQYYTPNEKVVLGCSTGPDSIFLLYELLKVLPANRVVACYFNHHLRPESDTEEKFLEDLGKEKGFIVEIGSGDIQKIKAAKYPSLSIEELSRIKRYQFFSAVCQIHETDKIMTAHHLDDKIETFFFNLARGSKLTGLVNMTEFHRNIVRPLLGIQKEQILASLDAEGIPYMLDASNFENICTRNRLRNEIIPLFYQINERFKKNISQTLDYFQDLKNYLDAEVNAFLAPTPGVMSLDSFQNLSPFLQKEIIRQIYYDCNQQSTLGLSEANIAEILRFIFGKNDKTHKTIKNLKMEKEKQKIYYSTVSL